MKKASVKYNLLLIIVLMSGNSLFAIGGKTEIKKNTFKICYSNISIEDDYYFFKDDLPNLQLSFNHNITNYLSLGVNIGLGIYEEFFAEKKDNRTSLIYKDNTNSIFYGLNSKLHILPLFIKSENLRFDLFLSGELGFITLNSSIIENVIPKRGNYFDYSLLGGVSVYLSKSFGLFAEAGYYHFKYYNGFLAKYGLTVRF